MLHVRREREREYYKVDERMRTREWIKEKGLEKEERKHIGFSLLLNGNVFLQRQALLFVSSRLLCNHQ